MKTREQEIQELLAKPIEVGQLVDVLIKYKKSSQIKKGRKFETFEVDATKHAAGKVLEIKNSKEYGKVFIVESAGSSWAVPTEAQLKNIGDGYGRAACLAEWVTPDISHCGPNPFRKNIPRIDFLGQDIQQLLSYCGYGRRNDVMEFGKPDVDTIKPGGAKEDAKFISCSYGGVNFDPYVIDKDGNRQYYQRGLVWSLEQKQLLIDSVYNGIEIGKFILRYRSWDDLCAEMLENGHGYNFSCVDGKQRLNALIEFVCNQFKDSKGYYFKDLSDAAKRSFFGYGKLALGKMDENTKDSDVVEVFLTLNFTGTPMSKEHIQFVQSIKI